MPAIPRMGRPLLAVIIVVGGILPIVTYRYAVYRAPTATVREARAMLSQPGANTVLVDVRPPEEYEAAHLDGAVNWPQEKILAMSSAAELPEALRGKHLLLVCQVGGSSAIAARKLLALNVKDVTSVRGGMEAWAADARSPCQLISAPGAKASGQFTWLPLRDSPAHEQWAAVLTGFVVKPFYMLLSLALVAILWRSRRPELIALKWGLSFFFLGEAFCAVNYLAFDDQSYLSEYLHSFGMVLCFGFTTWAFFEGLDRWLIRYSHPGQTCAALPLCRECIKYATVPCGLRRLFYLLIPAHIALAFMPLVAAPKMVSYNTRIFGTLYNYSHAMVFQLFEIRYLPVAAILLMTVSLALLVFKKADPVPWSKLFFAAGMGPLGFSLLRLFIYAPYRENQVWYVFWEEVTELMFVCGAAIVLWIFRRGLFTEAKGAEAVPDGTAT